MAIVGQSREAVTLGRHSIRPPLRGLGFLGRDQPRISLRSSGATLEGRFANKRIDADRVDLRIGAGFRRFKVQWDGADGSILRQETLPD